MSREFSTPTTPSLTKTQILLDNIADEFVEIPLGKSPQPQHTPARFTQNTLVVEDSLFEEALADDRKVVSAQYTPPARSSLLKNNDQRKRQVCSLRKYRIGIASFIPLLIQKLSLSYAFWMVGEDWGYGTASGLLLFALMHDFLLASAPVYHLLKKPTSNVHALYENGKTPKLPIQAGSYDVMHLFSSGFGILSSAILYGYAESKLISPSINSLIFDIVFCILAVIARIINELEVNSIATLCCYLLSSETARAPTLVSAFTEWGSMITFYRDYLSFLKAALSITVCCFFISSIDCPSQASAHAALAGIVIFLALIALIGENYRINWLNHLKSGLKPKNVGDQVGRQILNLALPYHLTEGITSIYRHSLSGYQKIIYALPVLVLMLSLTSAVLSLLADSSVYLTENISFNALLFATSTMMGLLALLSFVRARYESAVALIFGNAYDSLLSAYWIQQLSQHPIAQSVLSFSTFSNETNSAIILISAFLFLLLTTTHTRYFIDQIIATKLLLPKKPATRLQMRAASHSFDSPPSWRKSLFRPRTGSESKIKTYASVARQLEFESGNPFDSSCDEEACANPFGADSDEERTPISAHLNPFG